MYCEKCGTKNKDGSIFCQECGAKLQQPAVPKVPTKQYSYAPITMWGYFGYEILFSIPLVGFILLLVFSFGGTNNINLRNFARSYFCFLILLVVLLFIFLLNL